MRLRKRLTALILALILLSVFSMTGFSASFTDVPDNSPYHNAISTMVTLGLLKGYEDGSFRPNDTITRAEFAAVITRALGMEEIAAGASSAAIFTDMTTNGEDHWATGYVKVAYDRKIILGMGDGTFAPDAPITYEQAVKMVVCTLGREAVANEKGGWPNGYILDANDINLTNNAMMSPTNSPAPRGIVAQLVFNSLEINLMERSGNGSIVQVNKTLLKDMLKISKFTNYMVTDIDGDIDTTNAATTGELVLESGTDAAVYVYQNIITSDEARDLLGLYVSGYYKVDPYTEDRVLLSIEKVSSNNGEVIIKSENIDAISGSRLTYWLDKENDKNTRSLTIASDAKLIYNGAAYNYLDSDDPAERNLTYWLSPNSENFLNGQIRLLDADGDGTYDSIFMEDYETYVVEAPVRTTSSDYKNNYIVYDKYQDTKRIQIDPYDRNNSVKIYNAKTGVEMRIEDIKAMNILSVANSRSGISGVPGNKFICYVSTDAISGTIEAVSSDGKYIINRQEYELTEDFKKAIEQQKVSMALESSGTFYLDMNGKIAAANITAVQAGDYMYITRAGKYKDGSDYAAVEVIALRGTPSTPEVIKIAASATINGRSYSDADTMLDVLEQSASLLKSNAAGLNAKSSQLAKIVIGTGSGGEKEIKSIRTAATVNGDGRTLDVGSNTDAGILKIGQENKEYIYSSGNFERQVLINNDTQVLVVPTNRSDTAGYSRSVGMSSFTTGYRYTIEAYDIANSYAKVVIVYGGMADVEIKSDTPPSLITSVSRKISSTGDGQVYSIEVYEDGHIKVYETENITSDYEGLKPGDVVRFGFNGSGQINKIEQQATTSDLKPGITQMEKDENGEYKFMSIVGTVGSLLDDVLVIAPAFVDASSGTPTLDTEQSVIYTVPSNIAVYRVRTNGASAVVETASSNDIIEFGEVSANPDASKIYAYAASGTLKMIVIYEL